MSSRSSPTSTMGLWLRPRGRSISQGQHPKSVPCRQRRRASSSSRPPHSLSSSGFKTCCLRSSLNLRGSSPSFTPMNQAGFIAWDPKADELAPLRSQIEKGFLERTQAALAGQLPVNPALLSDLAENERTLRETLRRQLGPGFETSSPGIESLGEFGQRRSELLESARRGDLTLAEQLGISRQQANDLQLQNLLR